VVAASGNEGAEVVNCPAAYPTVIAVGATRYDGTRAYYSNGGAALDIVAPGGDLLVDQNGDGQPDGISQVSFCNDPGVMFDALAAGTNLYGEFCTVMHQGTAMAAPHVSATVALMLGENPSLTPDLIRSYLQSTARDYGVGGWDASYGWGLLSAGAAVAAAIAPPPPPPPPPPPTTGTVQGVVTDIATRLPIAGATVTLRMRGDKFTTTSTNDGSYILSGISFGEYRATVSASSYHAEHGAISVSQSFPVVTDNVGLEKIKGLK
jgi:serine protease